MPQYKNFAFISYSHHDMAMAKWLQRKLESYRMPTEAHSDVEGSSHYLRPVFRDQSDLNTGILSDELHRHLEESKFLILICSPASAQSKWVSDEAKAFVGMGRLANIIPVIVDGDGIADNQLFPIFLRRYFAENPQTELLGINMSDGGRDKALIRIVSKMLDIAFDKLWRRHKRQRQIRNTITMTTTSLVASIIYFFAIPIYLNIDINPEISELPVGDEIDVSVNGATYSVPLTDSYLDNIKLPGYARFSSVDINVESQYFTPINIKANLGLGIRHTQEITIKRDSTFARFNGFVYDSEMQPLEGAEVSVSGHIASTDSNGRFTISLPLEQQRAYQSIIITKQGFETKRRIDESPGDNLQYILRKR